MPGGWGEASSQSQAGGGDWDEELWERGPGGGTMAGL